MNKFNEKDGGVFVGLGAISHKNFQNGDVLSAWDLIPSRDGDERKTFILLNRNIHHCIKE